MPRAADARHGRRPLVSVVIAAFDEERFIAAALESVLAQTYRPVEVLVVDDGSADGTARIAEEHGVRVVRRRHDGPAAARNAGVTAAAGDYWTIFDADDLMPPDRLRDQVAYLEAHPHHGMVLGMTEAFVTPGEPRPAHYNAAWDDGPFPACAGTMMARREVFALVGPYDETLWLAYDVDWLARAKDAGVGAGRIDSLALRYRIHPGNTSADRPNVHAAMLGLLRASLGRRRSPAGPG